MPLDASEWHVHRALDATEWHNRASPGRRPGDATTRRLGWWEGVCGTPAYQSPPRRSRSLVRMRDHCGALPPAPRAWMGPDVSVA